MRCAGLGWRLAICNSAPPKSEKGVKRRQTGGGTGAEEKREHKNWTRHASCAVASSNVVAFSRWEILTKQIFCESVRNYSGVPSSAQRLKSRSDTAVLEEDSVAVICLSSLALSDPFGASTGCTLLSLVSFSALVRSSPVNDMSSFCSRSSRSFHTCPKGARTDVTNELTRENVCSILGTRPVVMQPTTPNTLCSRDSSQSESP